MNAARRFAAVLPPLMLSFRRHLAIIVDFADFRFRFYFRLSHFRDTFAFLMMLFIARV
jgi:hypothetical protein